MRDRVGDWLRGNLEKMDFSDFTVVSEASGESNDNLILDTDAGKRVLKVSKEISTDRLSNEARCLEFLAENNVSQVPEPVFFEEDTEAGDVLVQTYAGDREADPDQLSDEQLRKLAQAIAEHQLPIKEYNQYFGDDSKTEIGIKEFFQEDFKKWGKQPYEEYLELADSPDERVKETYQRHRKMIRSIDSNLKMEQSFIHGDLAANIRVSGDNIYIIDWELGRTGAREIELLYLFEHSDMTQAKREKVIEYYSNHRNLSEGFEKARKIYPKALAFNDMVWAAKRKEKARKQEDEDAERYEEMFEARLEKLLEAME